MEMHLYCNVFVMDLLMCHTLLLLSDLWSLVFLVVTIIHSVSVSCQYEMPKACLEIKTLELYVPFLLLLWSLLPFFFFF